MDILIGADPELFVSRGGQPVSAYGLIPGTKEVPHPVDCGAVQVDGMALEFNIKPSHTQEEFVHNINSVLHTLRSMVPEDYDFELSATMDFDPEYMKGLPKEAVELGCDPDYNAYTGAVNPRPDQHPTMRTAAGHIHVGWTEGADPKDPEHFGLCLEVAREMDAWAGVYSVVADRDQRRRQMYGQAGAFRPKPYGCEYRVLSNFWVGDDRAAMHVWELARIAVSRVASENPIHEKVDAHLKNKAESSIQQVINEGNMDVANYIRMKFHAV